MDVKHETAIIRSRRLFQSVLTKTALMHYDAGVKLSYDALLDSFIAIFEQCSKDGLMKEKSISYFVQKYKYLVSEIRNLRVGLNDFELKAVIGRGYFGEVHLAQEKATGDLYSLKIINKAKTLNTASGALFEEERDILCSATSPWLTCLQYAFQDNINLYLVMEYMPGGDLLSLLEREGGRLPADSVRFYLAEILIAINALHIMGYVHRDVKPDNILLDRCGHIKLADFGSAARLTSDGRVTTAMPAGTPDYVAPEVLKVIEDSDGKRTSYGVECDFWSLGVVAYALTVGRSPFSGSRTSITYSKILKHRSSISYPDEVSVTDTLKDLINGLLRPNLTRFGYEETRKHTFFMEIDFNSIREVPPPYVPMLASPEDTSNFSCDKKSTEPVVTPRENSHEFSGRQLPFVGFTYCPYEECEKSKLIPDKIPGRKSETLRKTNQELLSKLVATNESAADRNESYIARQLEKAAKERNSLLKELSAEKQESAMLRRMIEQERLERKQMEEEALSISHARIQAKDREHKKVVKEFQKKIEELTDRLTVQNTLHNEMVSRCERAENEVAALRLDLDCVKVSENACQEKLAKKIETTFASGGNSSFLEMENNEQRECVRELQAEIEKLNQEKLVLQSRLQTMKEHDKENADKLTEVVKKLGALELEVVKLERENVQLKETKTTCSEKDSQHSENETKYKQKVIFLEERIVKLEGQIERLREAAVIHKRDLSSAQSKLYETEKKLSNATIDVRIAKRETKAAEDEIKSLQEQLKQMKEKTISIEIEAKKDAEAHAQKLEALNESLQSKEREIEKLKSVQIEIERLAGAEKSLQGEYETLRRQLAESERQLNNARLELKKVENGAQELKNENIALSTLVEELRNRISSLELNNSCLKEATAILDEQVGEYEKFTTEQSEKTQMLQVENAQLLRKLADVEMELQGSRTALSEVSTMCSQSESKISQLEAELAEKTDNNTELRIQVDATKNSVDSLSQRLMNKEKAVSDLEIELYNRDRVIEAYQSDVLWLKEESSAHLTNFYAMKEANDKLNIELEEESRYSEALQERIRELEGVITELEAFHKQRELKDDATKQQQTKLIAFLQSKLQEDKKKKTFAGKLFGQGRKDTPSSPQTPAHAPISPRPASSKSTDHLKKKVLSPPVLNGSPGTQQILSQLVDSPSTRMQRQASLPRMHHKIPHRFKTQRSTRSDKCVGCHDTIPRGTRTSVCSCCNALAHPKCALTAPKTCGLPPAFAKHFAKVIEKPLGGNDGPATNGAPLQIEGWVDVLMPGESSWKRKYVRIEGSEVLFYETKPDETVTPSKRWDLQASDGQILVSDSVGADEVSSVAKQDLPFVIKVVNIPSTTCWPSQAHYFLVLKPSDKVKWIAALQSACQGGTLNGCVKMEESTSDNRFPVIFVDDGFGVNCMEELTDQLTIFGCDKGLFSLRNSSAESPPVQIHGVTSIHTLSLAPHINSALLICGESRRLVSTDYRLLVSNAGAAACSNPGIRTEEISFDSDDPVLHFSISLEIGGVIYLTVAIATRVILLRWDVHSSKFNVIRIVESREPCSCISYYKNSVIIGCETVHAISLEDLTVREFLTRPVMKRSFIRICSFPMHCVVLKSKEVLLCYSEFGLFVNENGEKSRADLKWANVPKAFVFCDPFLYVIGVTSIELVKIAKTPEVPSTDDSSSISTVATINDSISLPFKNPRFLGKTKNGIFVSNGDEIVQLTGHNAARNELGSFGDLKRVGSDGQFSFTSSLMGSLDGSDLDESPLESNGGLRHTAL